MINNIGILGAGTFGIALARLLANKDYNVTVYSHSSDKVLKLKETNRHERFSDIELPGNIKYTSDIRKCASNKDILVFALPSTTIREVARSIKDYVSNNTIIVDVSKGIEKDSLLTLSEVIKQELNNDTLAYVVLSGPTHAEEVIRDMPTAIVSASDNENASKIVQETFADTYFRVYTNSDVLGIEICGALKNIMAIAAGISDGLGYGDNGKAALITRGLQEIKRLGSKMGCKDETFFGLAGVGDLIVTCTSKHSRNNRCGYLIGQGLSVDDAKKEIGMVVEGLNALPAATKLADKYGVDMPITMMLNRIINEGFEPYIAVKSLFERELKSENYGY